MSAVNASPLWPCGHPRTEANTQSVGRDNGSRCRTCRRAVTRRSAAKYRAATTPAERRLVSRVYHLPLQLQKAREKLARLETEARDLRMFDLLECR